MKNKIKAYLILLFTGWHSVKYLGNPKGEMNSYIVCLENNAVMEFNYSIYHIPKWYKVGIGEESVENPVIFWRSLPKPPCERNLY